MKKLKWAMGLFMCLAMVLTFIPQTAFAAEIVNSGTWGDDNLTWELDEDGTLTISGTGAMDDMPEILKDRPWPRNYPKIKQIIIEDGVTSIGKHAFQAFSNLASVTIPDSVTSIGDWAFSDCETLTNVTIPDSVTSIGDAAFWGCSDIRTVSIGNGVTSIGLSAFRECSSLESVTIPASVTSFGYYVFWGCSSLTDVTFEGDAPKGGYLMFDGVTATVHYPQCSGTWTDEVGQDYGDTLTWVGNEHFEAIDEAKAPTCVETGLTEGKHCSVCNEVLVKQKVIPAGHKGKWMGNSRAATCSQTGIKEGAICSSCGHVIIEAEELPIDPNNHKHIVVDKSVKATSTKTGLTEGSHCEDCGKVIKKQTLTLAKPVLISGTKNIARKKIVVKWKKNSTCTGYQVKYVTGSTTKTVKVTSKSTLSKTLKKLKKGKTYKVYVRCYKTVDGKTYYSAYSTAKSVKVKK